MTSFVLVHGAFEGGWGWSRVAPIMRRRGHDVLTPTLTGSGERFHLLTREVSLATHIEDIASALEHEDLRDVVLVGHSYGGTVITGVADRAAERVARVVYLDASAPVDGQAASGAFAAGTSDVLAKMAEGEGWLLPPLPLEAFGVTRAEDVAWVNARRHPHPMRTLHEPLRLARRAQVARSYVACARHEGLVALFGVDPLAPFAQRARAEGWGMQTIDAPHAAMITHPEAVADALLRYV